MAIQDTPYDEVYLLVRPTGTHHALNKSRSWWHHNGVLRDFGARVLNVPKGRHTLARACTRTCWRNLWIHGYTVSGADLVTNQVMKTWY